MAGWKINNRGVQRKEWDTLLQLMHVVGQPRPQITEDRHISPTEIRDFLDSAGNQDRYFGMEDCARLLAKKGARLFLGFKDVLEKTGFNMYRETADFAAWTEGRVDIPVIFWKDSLFAEEAFRVNPMNLQFAAHFFKQDAGTLLKLVHRDTRVLQYADKNLLNNLRFMEEAVRIDGRALRFAGSLPRKNREIVLSAVRRHGEALFHADPSFRDDREIVLAAVGTAGWVLSIASERLRNDREVVLRAVNENGYALQFTSAALRADREIVEAAVRRNGRALQYAAETLRGDPSIVQAAILEDGSAIEFALGDFLNIPEYFAAAIRHLKPHGLQPVFRYAVGHLLRSEGQLEEVLWRDPRHYDYLPEEARKNRELALRVFAKNGLALGHADPAFRSDVEAVVTAVRQNPEALRFADSKTATHPRVREEYRRTREGWVSDLLDAPDIARWLRETSMKERLEAGDLLRCYLFQRRFRSEGKRFSSAVMTDLYDFAVRRIEQEEGAKKIIGLRAKRGEEPETLFALERGTGLYLFAWTDRETELPFNLVPASVHSAAVLEGTLKIPANKLTRLEIFSGSWTRNNTRLTRVATPYQLRVKKGKEWVALGDPFPLKMTNGRPPTPPVRKMEPPAPPPPPPVGKPR